MALEAGTVMHEVFAAVRIWQLEWVQELPKHALAVASRIFDKARWKACLKECTADPMEDQREHLMELAFAILHSSEFEDNPLDSVRTIQSMELASIQYIDEQFGKMMNWPIYVEDLINPNSRVGIEQVFDVVLLYEDGKQYRYIGTVDGLVHQTHHEHRRYYLDENKTANRLDSGWRAMFDMSHQITGYCAAAGLVFGFPIEHSRVTGVKIKPTNKGEDTYVLEPLKRNKDTLANFARWFRHTVEIYEMYKDNYEEAPRYTHSCNRYFRPCALQSFCCDTAEGRKEQWGQMVPASMTPSERAIMEG